VVVNIENFHHSTLEIEAGQTVIWVNTDGVPYTITAGRSGAANGGFDSLLIGAGQTYSHRFEVVGEFEFICTVHPQMNGTIIVVPKSVLGVLAGGGRGIWRWGIGVEAF
jgi:plastocyanin